MLVRIGAGSQVIRLAFDEKEKILPLQSMEVLKIRNQIDAFAEDRRVW